MSQIIATLFFLLAGLPLLTVADSWQENRIIPLQKVTVGPWDNFEATISSDDKLIFYTRDQNQISNIYQQSLLENESHLFIGSEGDAKDPALNPDGLTLAFTYFKNDAQGDICLMKLADGDIRCITDAKTVDESPFWIGKTTIGFLRRPIESLKQELVTIDLISNQENVLYSGMISAPLASPNMQYIVFNEVEKQNQLKIKVLETKSGKVITPPRFELPGTSGFMAFSLDGQHLYFNHYLSDSNFDQVINANDHSVAFRIAFQEWLNADTVLLPEQLSSVEYNCKFPAVSSQNLYLTCAFGGSLDIYSLPLSGSISAKWNEAQLWEAHKAARSYEDRLLLLNTIRYRFKADNTEILERILINHLEIGEYTAAGYYVDELVSRYKNSGNEKLAQYYQLLNKILAIRSSKLQLPDNIITARFKSEVEQAREQAKMLTADPVLITFFNAQLDYELNNSSLTIQSLATIDLAQVDIPLLHYMVYNLYEVIYQNNNPDKLLSLYTRMFNDSLVSQEARLFYANNYLKLLAEQEADIQLRTKAIEHQISQANDDTVKTLLQADIIGYQLAQISDAQQQGPVFKQLTSLINTSRDDAILRKILHIRAIQILAAADQLQYMETLSRNWLTITKITEIEFYNVAEQYSVVTMDKGYGRITEGNLAKAYATFYSAILQTNDLEAHYHFLTMGLDPSLDKKENMEKAYADLEKQNLFGVQKNYVSALRLVLDYEKNTKETKKLDEALALIKPMPNVGSATAMRELLTAYIYHTQLRSIKKGFAFDKTLYQKAHYHYMMALDFGRGNTRVTTTVLQNLGWLHFEVRNYGLSTDFFQQRLNLPFITASEEIATRWAFAKALYYNYQHDKAFEQAKQAMQIAETQDKNTILPFLEKTAFYAMQAQMFEEAVKYYGQLLSGNNTLSPENQTKALLGYSYALMKTGKNAEASKNYEKVIGSAQQLKPLPASELRMVSFQPLRLELLALGFLAQIDEDPKAQAGYLSKRITLLDSIKKNVDDYTLDEAKRLSLIAKDYQYQALKYEAINDLDNMANAISGSLKNALLWVDISGDELGPVIHRTLINYFSLALSHKDVAPLQNNPEVKKIVERMNAAYDKIPYRTDFDKYQQVKLQIFWYAYIGDSAGLQALLNGELFKSLKPNQEISAELAQYAAVFHKQ